MSDEPAAILDVDGTLVDTNYHHALAWHRAFRSEGCVQPLWVIHRHMGMGGDQLVAAVAGDAFERAHGDAVRDAEKELYGQLIDEVVVLPGARELVAALRDSGRRTVLASSAKEQEVEHYVGLLGAEDLPATTSADVEQTKPEPDLVLAALEKVGGGPAVLLGDSTWDCLAAARASITSIAVQTGGFCPDELRDAGAERVFEDLLAAGRHLGVVIPR